MARSPIDDVKDVVTDAAYVSVGLGLIAFQRLQVRRQELNRSLGGRPGAPGTPFDAIGTVVAERLKMVEERLGAALAHR